MPVLIAQNCKQKQNQKQQFCCKKTTKFQLIFVAKMPQNPGFLLQKYHTQFWLTQNAQNAIIHT